MFIYKLLEHVKAQQGVYFNEMTSVLLYFFTTINVCILTIYMYVFKISLLNSCVGWLAANFDERNILQFIQKMPNESFTSRECDRILSAFDN